MSHQFFIQSREKKQRMILFLKAHNFASYERIWVKNALKNLLSGRKKDLFETKFGHVIKMILKISGTIVHTEKVVYIILQHPLVLYWLKKPQTWVD